MRNEEQVGYQIKELGRLLDRNIYQKSILMMIQIADHPTMPSRRCMVG